MPEALIVDAVRTPIGRGRPGGLWSGVHPADLLAAALRHLVARTGVDPVAIEDVIAGCVSQAGEQTFNLARTAVLAAGWPESVPAVTIDRQCGSSQQAVHFAAQAVMAGTADLVVACGVESMSRVPLGSSRGGADPFGPGLRRRYQDRLVDQGLAAELIAARWAMPRPVLDAIAVRSHQRAAAATAAGHFAADLVPVAELGPEPRPVGPAVADEGIRPETTLERLQALAPAFWSPERAARYPGIGWVVTAGNASQISDGAAAVLVASPAAVARHRLRPRARVRALAVVGSDPVLMLTGVVPATRAVLARAGLGVDDIGCFEVNEAFAPVVQLWQQEFGVEAERVNVHGGAIALGHPLGASGARLLTTLVGALEQRAQRFGLQVMCEGGGLANATVVERLPAAG